MTAVVLRGDARRLPLPDGCADLIVTSPPYFGLRSYTDGGGHYDGQIGSEASPGERARALQVPKPPPVPDGQASLFDEAS